MELESLDMEYRERLIEAYDFACCEAGGVIERLAKLDPDKSNESLKDLHNYAAASLERLTAKLEEAKQAKRIAETSGADMFDEADTIPSWDDGNYTSADDVKREIEGAQYISYGTVKKWENGD